MRIINAGYGINNNIRCFEISVVNLFKVRLRINNNIRCFEMLDGSVAAGKKMKINNNIRCFEM